MFFSLRSWTLTLLIALMPAAAWAAGLNLLIQEKSISGPSALTQLGWAKRHAWVRIAPDADRHLNATSTATSDVTVQLFEDTVFVLQEQSREIAPQGGTTTIRYNLRSDPEGSAVLSATQGHLVGTITTGDHRVFRIMPGAEGIHRVEELDHSKFPDCATHSQENLALAHSITSAAKPPDSTPQADSGSQINVLVAYTQSVLLALGSTSAVQSLIATAISETNSGYSTSGVNTALNLVHTVQVSYDESGGFPTALNAITGTSDGQMDEVHALRNAYAADLVVLLIDNPDYCGMAHLPPTVSTSNAGLGFSVTAHNCATGYYSFGHEIGHNMGARHDRYVDSTSTARPYIDGFGYVNKSARIRSIMAYNNDCTASGFNCTRVNHWSSSDRLYSGTSVIGDSNNRNNNALNGSITAVANYRNATALYTLNVSKSSNGTGTVISNPAGISCGSTCSASFNTGTTVTLTATADSNSVFAGWSGSGCSGTGTCTVTMSAAQSVSATFNLKPAPVTPLSLTGLGGATGSEQHFQVRVPEGATDLQISISGGTGDADLYVKYADAASTSNYDCRPFADGNSETCTFAIPASGTWHIMISGWEEGPGFSGLTLTVTYQASGTAYTLSVSKAGAGSGTVSSSPAGVSCGVDCQEPFASGSTVTLTATPASGSKFNGWSGGGCTGNGSCTLSMSAARSVTATFAKSASITPILMLLLD